jgi:hypothetical protein
MNSLAVEREHINVVIVSAVLEKMAGIGIGFWISADLEVGFVTLEIENALKVR